MFRSGRRQEVGRCTIYFPSTSRKGGNKTFAKYVAVDTPRGLSTVDILLSTSWSVRMHILLFEFALFFKFIRRKIVCMPNLLCICSLFAHFSNTSSENQSSAGSFVNLMTWPHLWIGPLSRLLEALVEPKKTPHVHRVHLQVVPENRTLYIA